MPRRRRIIIPGKAHHITQRGNNRKVVFEEEADYKNYCFWINKYAKVYGVEILAYCLMSNHVHFIIKPKDACGVSRLFNTVHMRYTQYVNYKNKTNGHLWQGRFFSCVMDDKHTITCVRYVDRNPVRAGMVQYPWNYPWSSARFRVGEINNNFIFVSDLDKISMKNKEWKEYLVNDDITANDIIRYNTQKGFACATDGFITLWEKKLGCQLKGLKVGRPQNRGQRPIFR
ncbi:MAG: putative transposase [Candidatus Omnitrophota bacterium]|jgi:putative transposase